MVVGPGIKTGLDIKIDHSQLGTDLVANTVAAVEKYKAPLLIVDSGTAITLTMVNARSELCGDNNTGDESFGCTVCKCCRTSIYFS